jgi:CDP-diacylglycerol--glycerol-3-phosphate 3-phosphatidyltransferase/cardiolipin synthase
MPAQLWTVPNVLSLTRVPLGAVFPLTIHRPHLAVLVLVAAAVTDVVDGWWARTRGQVTTFGAVLDPVSDKLFVVAVVTTLVATGALGWRAVLCLATRDIGEAPLVMWFLLSAHMRARRAKNPGANVPGKLATALQFACVALAILRSSPELAASQWSLVLRTLLATSGIVGAFAAISYWRRALHSR